MLTKIRSSADSGILKGIIYGMLTLGAIGLAFTSGNNFFRDGFRHDTTVATIGRVKIDARTFDEIVRRDLREKGLNEQLAYRMGYINRLLEQQIAVNLMARGTDSLDIAVNDATVKKELRRLLKPATEQGLTMKQAAEQVMRAQGMSEQQLIETVRSDTANQIVRGALEDGTSVESPAEARDLALYAGEKRVVKVAYLPDSSVKDYKTPTDAVLKPFYEAGKERYAIPETRAFTIAVMTDKALNEKPVSDADLHKLYESRKASLALPERRTIDQAILQDEVHARAVVAAVHKGESLKDAVHSVTGSIKAFTGTQTYQKNGLSIKPLADAAFAAKKGDVIGPVQSPLGWHVMVVTAIEAPETPSFESVKERLRAAAENDRAGEALYTESTKLDDALAGGGTLEDAVKTFHLDTVKIGPVRADGSSPKKDNGLKNFTKDTPRILKTAFAMAQGEISPVFGLSGDRYAVIELDTLTPKSYKTYDDVKGELSRLWITDQQSVLNKDRVKDALSRLNGGKMTLDQLAKADGGTVKTLTIDRVTKNPPQPLDKNAALALFAADKGDVVSQPVGKGIVVGTVESVTLPDLATIPKDKIQGVSRIAMEGMRDSILETYLDTLRQKYKVTINDALLKQTYDKKPDDTGGL